MDDFVITTAVVFGLFALGYWLNIKCKKWWLIRWTGQKEWDGAVKLTTIFGIPLCFCLFEVQGPYKTQEDAEWCL